MKFLLAFFAFFEHRRSSFPLDDLDDRFACFSFSTCCFSPSYVDAVASCCTPHVSYMLSFFYFVSVVLVTSMHFQYMPLFCLSCQCLLKIPVSEIVRLTLCGRPQSQTGKLGSHVDENSQAQTLCHCQPPSPLPRHPPPRTHAFHPRLSLRTKIVPFSPQIAVQPLPFRSIF